MKKKLFMTLLCTALAVCSLAGCAVGGEGSSGGSGNSGAGIRAIDGEMALLATGSIYSDCGTDHGYYYIDEEGTHLMYIDYESKQEIYLCNRPGCSHDTAECPSYIDSQEGAMENSLFYYKDHLYLFSHPYDNDGAVSSQTIYDDSLSGDITVGGALAGEPAALYRMNPDGTQREKVYVFDEGLTVEETVLHDDSGLYFVTKKLKSEKVDSQTMKTSSEDRTLIRVDAESWKAEKICDLEQEKGIMGSYKNQLVLSCMKYDHELTDEEKEDDDKFRKAVRNSESVYTLFDVKAGEEREVFREKNDKLGNTLMKGQYLYTAKEGEDRIWKIDLETGEKNELCKTPYNNLNDIYDDVICCWSWESDDGIITNPANYFIHLDDGSIETSKLKNHYKNYSLELRAETPTQFLVVYDYDAQTDPLYPNQDEIFANKFALIDKADLYRGKENYEKIHMTSSGM